MNHTAKNRPTNSKPKATSQRRRCRLGLEALEDRCLLNASPTNPTNLIPVGDFRPITEVGNNVANPTEGTAGTDLLRLSPVAYADRISSPSLPNNPGARVISDIVFNQADPANPSQDIQTVNQASLSDFGYAFGQFMDHDMDMTPGGSGQFDNILADPNDPSQMATQTFERSTFDPNTGTSTSNPRQQVTNVTAFLDLSNIYGSNQTVANALRTFSGGLLKTAKNGQTLPYDNTTYFTPEQIAALNMTNSAQLLPESQLFAAGDERANENIELTALQTLFVLNHNQIATQLATMNPHQFGFSSWNDENLYQEARKLNIAEYQNIVYTQYLPDLLGPDAPTYTGYNPNINPSIATEFSTVAFRFGHSLLSNSIQRQDNNGNNIPDQNPNGAPVDLAQDFDDPSIINPSGVFDPTSGHTTSGINAILKGDADGDAQAMDASAINEIRNLLFANGAAVDNGQDLISRDIQRGRDDGIGTYNQVREAFGLAPVTSFAQITSNVTVQKELEQAYNNNINEVDAFVGGSAEDLAPGSSMGQTFSTILNNQFSRLINGDRFFYLNEQFTRAEDQIMDQGETLGDVIENNTNITNLQADVFKFTASISGTVATGTGRNSQGVAGVTVELEDTSGDVLATTTTDRHGNYTFTQQSGPSANPEIASGVSATGNYQIVLVLPNNLRQVGPNPGTIDITRGGLNVTGVNFSVRSVFHSSSSSSGSSSSAPAAAASPMTAAGSSGGVFSSGGVLTLSSSATPAASSVDVAPSATTTSIAMALSNSTGSGTAATPQASTPSGQTPSTSLSNSASSQTTTAFIAKPAKVSPSVEPSSSAAGDDQTVSG